MANSSKPIDWTDPKVEEAVDAIVLDMLGLHVEFDDLTQAAADRIEDLARAAFALRVERDRTDLRIDTFEEACQ